MRLRAIGFGILAIGVLWGAGVAQGSQGRRIVLGYYVPYDSSSWSSLVTHAEQLDVVAAQWVSIDSCGNIGARDDQTLKEFVRHNTTIKLVPSLFTLSASLNHRLVTDEDVRSHAIEQIVSYTIDEAYAGFDLDLEGVDAADRPALTEFVKLLSGALHDSGKLLTLAVPAKERDVTQGWAGAYDYPALGSAADLVTIMAYEYRGPFSGPGSVAPYDWVARVTAFATAQMQPEKVLLGLSFYGYDWNTTSGGTRSLGYEQTMALAERFGAETGSDPVQRSLTFGYTANPGELPPPARIQPGLAHTLKTRVPPACEVEAPAAPRATEVPSPLPGTPQDHEVWYEDSASAATRLEVAAAHRAGGVSAWRLGLEDPNVWPLFEEWRQPDQGV